MAEQTQYLVEVKADTARLLVVGRASYLNCMSVADFIDGLFEKGLCRYFYADLRDCTGMDSTFLGILAGAALRFRKMAPPGRMVLQNLGARNMELVENLGLDRILEVENCAASAGAASMKSAGESSPATQERMLEAHEDLVRADSENLKKFEDVILYLRRQEGKEPLG